jgi:signal transduction histidine kinase
MAPLMELNLFRILQEAVNNAVKHAHTKNVHVRISLKPDIVVLKIQDDGRGFEPTAPAARTRRAGLGLSNMRERAVASGGSCEIESAPGRGTTITVRVPAGRESKR